MSRNVKRLVFFVLLFFLVTRSIHAQSFTAPYQVRSILFRVLDFFNDAVDDPNYDPTAPINNIPPLPTNVPAPTTISGSCPFQATAYVRECEDYSCTRTKSLSAFDNNQQYGVANDLRIKNKGDAPVTETPFGHAGNPGEVVFQDASLAFPTTDGYNQQDPADVKVFLDANKDGILDNNFEIGKKVCESFGTTDACPSSQKKYSSTDGPLDTIMNMIVDCNVNVRYGWLLRKKGSSTSTNSGQTPTTNNNPTARPTNPAAGRQNPLPTSSNQLTTAPTSSQSNPSSTPNLNSQIQNLINQITESGIRNHLTDLVDDDTTPEKDEKQTRYSGTGGNQKEATNLKNYFDSLGLQSELQPFSVTTKAGNIQTNNIIARIPGKKTNEVYLMTAHMDTTSESVPSGAAPGADDNGSGTSAVMEAARAFMQSGIQPNYTIEFILFSGEEEGLVGSTYYVRNLPSGKIIKGVFNLDMIGYNPSGTCIKFGYKSYNGDNILSEAVVKANTDFNIGLQVQSIASDIDRSDHAPFWRAGKPAVFGYECNVFSNPRYHKTTDTLDYLNFDQITKTAKAVTAAVGRLVLQ